MINQEHILGLLSGKLYEERRASLEDGKKSVAQVMIEIGITLSISKKDIYDYLKKNGYPPGLVVTKESGADGAYVVKQADGRYAVYSQERGSKYGFEVFDNYDQVLINLADSIATQYGLKK